MSAKRIQRLRDAALNVTGEPVIGAFEVTPGPRPGIEATLAPLFGILGILGFQTRRKTFSTIVTNSSVQLWSSRRGVPISLVHRFSGHGAMGSLEGHGDYYIAINSEKYWVRLMWVDEARRTIQLIGSAGWKSQ